MTETFTLVFETENIIRVLLLAFISFVISMMITPLYTTVAYRYKWWKQQRSEAWSGGEATVYKKLHAEKHKRNIPTMAGIVFVSSVALVTLLLNLDRGQTWLPLAGMIGSGSIGLLDDWINIRGFNKKIAGMRAKIKFMLQSVVVLIGGWLFFAKLDVSSIHLPWLGQIQIGIMVILLFWFVVIATANAVNITDGLDGLAGGLLVSSFSAYGAICLIQGKFALAGFCLSIVGALLSYTWFNIYPARFFMGDTGAMSLGVTLGIIAMLTNSALLLPLFAIILVLESGSVIIQILSKKFRKKKIFLSTPIHHHFEALGWPETKVTMRFWIISAVTAAVGLVIGLLGK